MARRCHGSPQLFLSAARLKWLPGGHRLFGLTILWPPAFPNRSPPHHFIFPMDVIRFHAEPRFQIICGRAWDWLGKVTGILPSFVSAVERMFPGGVSSEQLVISDKSCDNGLFSTLCVCLLPSLSNPEPKYLENLERSVVSSHLWYTAMCCLV